MKSVIKALSGRRQSPSPTFQRSSIGIVGDAERTDRDVIPEQSLLATDESEGFPLSEAEVRPDLTDSGVNSRAYLKLLKIRSLHGNEQEQKNLEEDSPGVRESRYFENLPDLQSSGLDFRLSGNVFGDGLERLASPHSPKTPSFPTGKRYEGVKESRETRGEGVLSDNLFGHRENTFFDAGVALERKRTEPIGGRDSQLVFRNDGAYPLEHTSQTHFSMPLSRPPAVGVSEACQSVRYGGEGIQNVTQRDSKRPKERSRDQAYRKRFSMGSSVPSFGSPRELPVSVGGHQ
jgi:hypothetical protein